MHAKGFKYFFQPIYFIINVKDIINIHLEKELVRLLQKWASNKLLEIRHKFLTKFPECLLVLKIPITWLILNDLRFSSFATIIVL